jgi:hypothetical protein
MNSQQPETATPDRGARSALIWGFILVAVGAIALVGQFWPDVERFIPLAIGLVLLVVFAVSRSYPALVGAGVMTGLGVGILVAELLLPNTDVAGASVTLGLGLGFISVWLISGLMRLKEHHFWPLIPGTILALVGVGLTVDLFSQDWSEYVVPAIVIVLGLAIMAVGYVRLNQGHGGSAA